MCAVRAHANLRGSWLAALALAVAVCASGIGPPHADAGGLPFAVALSVTPTSTARADEVTVVARSVKHVGCVLEVRAGRIARSFARASTGGSGKVTWRWHPVGIASDVPWKFTVTCRSGAAWSRSWVDAELGFASSGRALVTSTSSASPTGVIPSGASCDSQGVCFANDPFPVGQCTWYAAGRRPDLLGIVHGNAGSWLEAARGRAPEGQSPVVGALAVWLPYRDGAGEAGHVAYVAALSRRGPILVYDSNWTPTPTSPRLQVHEHQVPWTEPSGYIYGGPAGAGPRA